jgi:hypothetical protein
MTQYLLFSISITFGSWLIGMILNELVKNKPYYKNISNLNFLKNESLNTIIGIGLFKWIVKNTIFKYLNQMLKMKKSISISQLIEIRKEMTYSEISHLIAFDAVVIVVIYKIVQGNFLFSMTIMVVNILLNLYPILLQQKNKRRIDNLIQKITRV